MHPKTADIGRYLNLRKKEFEQLLNETAACSDKKHVHDLRVATRRLRATLWILRHSSAQARNRKLDRALKKILNYLGPVRELDVAVSDAKSYGLRRGVLKSKRRRARTHANKALKATPAKAIRRQMKKAVRGVQAQPDIDFCEVSKRARDRLSEFQKKSQREIIADLHPLRIEVKKARYILEALGVGLLSLQHLQEALGKSHDLEVLISLVGESPRLKKDFIASNRRSAAFAKPALLSASRRLERLR